MTMVSLLKSKVAARVHVLVIDDIEANRSLLARRLDKMGYLVSLADSGAAALAMLASLRPHVILLDYMMPQMSGIEVLRRLRGDRATCDIPVIMVTARAEGDAVRDALSAGADDYVTKPIEFDVLRARMETQLAKQRKSRDLQRAATVLDERVTLRSMALSDAEQELRDETNRRLALEARIDDLTEAAPTASNVELKALLADIATRFEAVSGMAIAGKILNLAQMIEIKHMLARADSLA